MHLRHLRLCFFFYSGNHWTTKVSICESVLSKHFIRRLLYQDVSDKCMDVIEYKLHRNLIKTLEWMNKNNLTVLRKQNVWSLVRNKDLEIVEISLHKLRFLLLKMCRV